MKKVLYTAFIMAFLVIITSSSVLAAPSPPRIYLGGREISPGLSGALIDGTSYMPIKALHDYFGGRLSWDQSAQTARYKTSGLEITATAGAKYILANGRALYAPGGIFVQDGRLMIPCRLAAQMVNGEASWDGSARTVRISVGRGFIENGEDFYDEDELYWLSRIISAESRGEPFDGQVAVGNVVLNRVESRSYPDTIYGVIFDRQYGVQFEPILNGTIYDEPAGISVTAAKLCLEGVDLSRGSIYFYNPLIAQSLSLIHISK